MGHRIDARSLASGCPISGLVLVTAIRAMLPLSAYPAAYVADPSLTTLIREGRPLRRALQQILQAPLAILPLWIPGHWLLALVRPLPERGEISLLNSAGTLGNQRVIALLKTLFATSHPSQPRWGWNISPIPSAQQAPGSQDCGIFTWTQAVAALYNRTDPPVASNLDTTTVRTLMAAALASSPPTVR